MWLVKWVAMWEVAGEMTPDGTQTETLGCEGGHHGGHTKRINLYIQRECDYKERKRKESTGVNTGIMGVRE